MMTVNKKGIWLVAGIVGVIVGTMIGVMINIARAASPASGSVNAPGWAQLRGGNAPYDYPSVAFTCHGHDGVYITSFSNDGATAGGGINVVVNDPECGGTR